MEITLKEWHKIKCVGASIGKSDCMCGLQQASNSLYQERWYKYGNAYYSLLFNQVACVWVQQKDDKRVFAFKHYNITQTSCQIEYFDNVKDLICRYIQLVKSK